MASPVELWTDGACSGNPGGPGGWAALLRMGSSERELSGGERESTNNRMELKAVIEGLRALTRPVAVTIHIDSSYVMKAFVEGRISNWQANGWMTKAKKPVANRDLWEELLAQDSRHDITWVKETSHVGVELNERVDRLAVAACRAVGGRQP